MIYIVCPHPTSLCFKENWLSNMASKSHLVGGHLFELHRMFFPHFIKPKGGYLQFVCLHTCVSLYRMLQLLLVSVNLQEVHFLEVCGTRTLTLYQLFGIDLLKLKLCFFLCFYIYIYIYSFFLCLYIYILVIKEPSMAKPLGLSIGTQTSGCSRC